MNFITATTSTVFVIFTLLNLAQSRPAAVQKDPSLPGFRPQYQSLEDFTRCHGAPCEQWDRTARKIKDVEQLEQQLLRKLNLVTDPIQESIKHSQDGKRIKREAENEEENTLDQGCEWLAEGQADTMKEGLEAKLRELDLEEEAKGGEGKGERKVKEKKSDAKGDSDKEVEKKEDGEKKKSRSGRQKRQIVEFQISSHLKWDRTISYKFDGRHTNDEQRMIREAIAKWESATCVRFDERPTSAMITEPHLVFTASRKDGCRSWVGKTFTEQQINLAPVCFLNTKEGRPIHEVGHALGLWHQQQRQDRDEHIKINWSNLNYYSSQFLKAGGTEYFDVPYDMSSIMHYGGNDGSRNSHPTIEAKNSLFQNTMGQRIQLSFNDAKVVNRAYCSDVCAQDLPFKCEHEGYQDPNQCDKCRCPDGWTGDDCSQVALSVNARCGGEMTVGDYPQYITSPGYQNGYYDNDQECNWHIKAAPGYRVILEFEDSFGLYQRYSGVCYHWVEVRYTGNMGYTGPRFCGNQRPTERITSEAEEMLLVFRSNWEDNTRRQRKGFKAVIRAEPNPSAPVAPVPKKEDKHATTTTTTTSTTTTTTTTTTPNPPSQENNAANGNEIWSCDFETSNGESDWCRMEQGENDDFDWTMQSGKTPSSETGPSGAYNGNHYIFIEASNPRRTGDKATIWMPLFEKRGSVCLSFHYSMFGFHVNLLETVVRRASGRVEYPFQLEGQQGAEWGSTRVQFNLDYGDQVGFTAFRGEAFSGDIALDGLSLTHGSC